MANKNRVNNPKSATPPLARNTVPIVSIGMPVYNGEKLIREAIDSLLAQTFTDFELIISDNASTDGTAAICKEYALKDKRINYIRQGTNLGASVNFNLVLNKAVGKYFMWAAHDDQWTEEYLMNATNILSNTRISFAFPAFELKSIFWRVWKSFNYNIFQFVGLEDKRQRVLNFLVLHHYSHKCNIVYSLFRTSFLKTAYQLQDISNDGALGAVLLSLGQGHIVKNSIFKKRYFKLWPGFLSFIYYLIYNNRSSSFDLAKDMALADLHALFPEYTSELKYIFNCYKPYSHLQNYRICEIEDLELHKMNT